MGSSGQPEAIDLRLVKRNATADAVARPSDAGGLAGFPAGMFPMASAASRKECRTLRLLVVDDDAALRQACCEIAAAMGFVPLGVGSVAEALERMRQQPAEMLLLDLKLPGGGGLKLLGEIKALYPEDWRWW